MVITGAGTINALGHDVPSTLAAMREGTCGIGPLDLRDVARLSIQIGGQVRGFEAEGRYNRQQMSLYDRFTQFTLAAAKEAIRDATASGSRSVVSSASAARLRSSRSRRDANRVRCEASCADRISFAGPDDLHQLRVRWRQRTTRSHPFRGRVVRQKPVGTP